MQPSFRSWVDCQSRLIAQTPDGTRIKAANAITVRAFTALQPNVDGAETSECGCLVRGNDTNCRKTLELPMDANARESISVEAPRVVIPLR